MATTRIPPPALKRDSLLWLLAAMALVLAPHLPRQPLWVGAFVGVIWAWRTTLAWRGLGRPPKLVILVLAAAGTALTFTTYGTLLGRDAGVVLLQLMLVLKLLEMRSLRDAMIAVFLGFFVVLTHFLHSQTLPMGAYMLGVVWLFIAALIALNRSDDPAPIELARSAGAMLLQAIPLMLVLFLLFPRVQGPLWGMPKDVAASVSGLSEEMSPGSIGSLALSDAIAFRAEFDGPMPASRALYWRAVVMDDFDGRTWRALRSRQAALPQPVQGIGAAIDYRVTLEPDNQRWIFALDLPSRIPPGTRLTADYQLLAAQPITARVRYQLSSYLQYRAAAQAPAAQLSRNLQLPPGNPRTMALALSFKERNADPQAVVSRALDYFRAENFTYTLTPPLLGKDAVDDFIFQSRAGFCEHYAGAFTLLMRAAGVPARVVTGYQGGEVNPIGPYLLVRQADAHAWSEVWLSGRGWVRVDPTAAVAPARLDSGIRAVIPAPDLIPGLIGAEQFEWLRGFQLSWDAVNNQWNQWVLGYNFEQQRRLLAQLGQKEASWQDVTIALMIASGIVVLALSAYLLLRRVASKRDPVVVAYAQFCTRLATDGIVRQPSEGPLDFSIRASQIRPEIAPAIAAITRSYVALRYGKHDESELKRLRRMIDAFG